MAGQVDPQTMLNLMREQCTDLAAKVNALELDKTEHTLVLQALEPLPVERKCFRMIGNVVVERTVGEVLPAVQKNRDQITDTIQKMTDMLSTKQLEADEFQKKHKLNVQNGGGGRAAAKEDEDEGGSQGVLI